MGTYKDLYKKYRFDIGGCIGKLHIIFCLYTILFLPTSVVFMIVTKSYTDADKNYNAILLFFLFFMVIVAIFTWLAVQKTLKMLGNSIVGVRCRRLMVAWNGSTWAVGSIQLCLFYAIPFLGANNIPYSFCLSSICCVGMGLIIAKRCPPSYVKYHGFVYQICAIYVLHVVLLIIGGVAMYLVKDAAIYSTLIMHTMYIIVYGPPSVDFYLYLKYEFSIHKATTSQVSPSFATHSSGFWGNAH